MHSLGKRPIAAGVAALMFYSPGWAATAKPLGMVLQAERAKLGRDAVQIGTNVYAGTSVSTEPHGALRMKLGPAQVFLGSDSAAVLQESEGRVTAELTRGSLGFSVQGEEALLIYAGGAWIRAQSTSPARGEILLLGAREIMVSTFSGSLEVIVEDEARIVPQNQTARVQVAPEYQEVQGAGTEKERRRRIVAFWLVPALTAAIVVPIVLYNTHPNRSSSASPSVP